MLTKMKEKLGQDLKKKLEEAHKKIQDHENDKKQLLEAHENEKQELVNTHSETKKADQKEKAKLQTDLQAWTEATNEVTEQINA